MAWRTSTVETERARFVIEAGLSNLSHAGRFTDPPEPFEYPPHFETRLVSGDSTMRWKSRKVFLSQLLQRHEVGLK